MAAPRRVASTAESLSCSVCAEAFDSDARSPRTLSCGHTFCTQCLRGIAQGRTFVCPKCRRETVLQQPADGAVGDGDAVLQLIRNYQLLDVIEEAAPQRGQHGDDQQAAGAAAGVVHAGGVPCKLCAEEDGLHMATHVCIDCGDVSAISDGSADLGVI